MNGITVNLMDTPSVVADGQKIVFPYRKVEGLFYYICVKKRITRDEAVSIFWADCDETNARKNLRDALYHIKKILGSEVIQLDGNTFISLNQSIRIRIDIDQAEGDILNHYKGEFLNYFYIKNCLEFENWMDDYRRAQRERYLTAAEKEAERAVRDRNPAEAIRFAGKLIEIYHLDESFYRKIIAFLVEEGEYSAAVTLYQKLSQALKQDLEIEPEDETKALIEQVLVLRKKVAEHAERERVLFTGRQRELYGIFDMVQKHRVNTAKESGNFALVTGEAGVGKTALLDQLRTLLEGEEYLIFSYSCCPSETELYLKPWNDLVMQIQEFAKRKKREVKTDRHSLSDEMNDYKIFTTQYGARIEELLRSLMKAFQGKELILFLDDIQWMDSSSIQLLNTLLFHLKHEPLFVVAACRQEPVRELEQLKITLMRECLMKQFDLNRFTLEETRELIKACSTELLESQSQVEQIYHYTDGNALFLTELLKILKDQGGKMVQENQMTSRMVSIIQSRLMKLSQEEQELLQMMSVFSHEVTLEDIRILYPQSEMKTYEVLEGLLAHQIIDERVDGALITYGFTHILIHNYVLSKISAGRKQIYYRKAAAYYEEKYKQTGDVSLMPDLIYYFENAHDTYKKYAYKLEYFKAFFSGKEEIYPVISAGFSEKYFIPDLDASENILIPLAEEIRALPQKDRNYQELRMKIEYLIGRYDLSSGDYKKGLRNMNSCIQAALTLEDPQYLMDSYLQMIFYSIQVYDLDLMKEYITRCSQLLETYTYPRASFYVVRRLEALHCIKTEQFEKAVELLEPMIPEMEKLQSIDLSQTAGLAACYNYRGEIYMKMSKWEDALTYISKAVTCSHGHPPTAGLGMAYTNMGVILYQLESYNKASEYFGKARAIFQNLSIQWGRAKEEAYSAALDLKLGKEHSALAHYKAACRYADKDYSPNTMLMLEELYQQLATVDGVEEPPRR